LGNTYSAVTITGGLRLKFLVVSDFHGNLNSAKALTSKKLVKRGGEVDAIVLCGDLSEFGSLDKGQSVLEEVQKGFVNVYYVTGNHDPPSLMRYGSSEIPGSPQRTSAVCLHGKAVRLQDVTFVGLSGFRPPFYGNWNIEGSPVARHDEVVDFLSGLFEKAVDELNSDPRRTILVTHDPPFGVCDQSVLTKVSAGSRGIREVIMKWKPLVALCGHIHEGRGIAMLGDTLVLNPGSVRLREAARLEIASGSAKAKLIKI
jgi:Icc-related predicted phosphoesterase